MAHDSPAEMRAIDGSARPDRAGSRIAAAASHCAGLGATFGPDVAVRAAKEGHNGGDFYLSGREPAPIVIIHRDNVCPADEATGLVPVADKVAPITKRDS